MNTSNSPGANLDNAFFALEFAPDGTADPPHFALENEDGAKAHVEIARLADEVRIYRE